MAERARIPRSALGAALANHEIVERIFGHLPPEIFVRAEGQVGIGDRLEPSVLQAQLRVKTIGRLEADFEDFLREEAQLRPSHNEPLQRRGVRRVILRPDAVVGERGRRSQRGLIGFRKGGELLFRDDEMQLRIPFHHAGK